jgi:hypothetical protein
MGRNLVELLAPTPHGEHGDAVSGVGNCSTDVA